MTRNQELVNALSEGKDWTKLAAAERAMLSYARNLSVDPSSIEKNDIAQLRELDFSDHAILEINLVAAYMNFVNRVAEGLGVELEASMQSFNR